jgi:hypothetical protein
MYDTIWAGARTKRGQPATFHLDPIEQKKPESTRALWPLECTASPVCALYLFIYRKRCTINGWTICNHHFNYCRFMPTGGTDTVSPASSYIEMENFFLKKRRLIGRPGSDQSQREYPIRPLLFSVAVELAISF